MRHKNVNMLCSIGALGFFLMSRFEVTEKIFDFATNKSWFNRKLPISPTRAKTLDKEMSFQHYPTVLKQIFSALVIVIEKYFHCRRLYGNMDGELNGDLSSSDLENLGNWLMTQREECNSTKLPLISMQVSKGGYFSARGTVVPPVELQQLVFPFVEKARIKMATMIANCVYRPTAMVFINMLEHLRGGYSTILSRNAHRWTYTLPISA
jgi:hypothetical protein